MDTLHSNKGNNPLNGRHMRRTFNVHKATISERCAGCPLITALKTFTSGNDQIDSAAS